MKKKSLFLLLTLFFSCFFPLSIASAVMPEENLYTGSSAYYICDLYKDDILILNLTHTTLGNFSMYLLNKRPLIDTILTESIVAEGLNIYYVASDTLIYYIQVYLSSNGPYTFILNVTRNGEDVQLIRYYIPYIPGFPLGFLVLMIFTGIGVSIFIWKRRIMKDSYIR